MLVVSGIIEINPDNLGAARAAGLKMMEETRKEAGCLVYEFSQRLEAPHHIRVYEEWTDRDALTAHFEAPHMGAFREALGEIGVLKREIFVFDGVTKEKL